MMPDTSVRLRVRRSRKAPTNLAIPSDLTRKQRRLSPSAPTSRTTIAAGIIRLMIVPAIDVGGRSYAAVAAR